MKLPLPLSLAEPQLFKRGALIKLRVETLSNAPKEKYCIVVNLDPSCDPALIILTTTKTSFFDRNPGLMGYFRVAQGAVPGLSKDSIINCREIHTIPKDVIRQRYRGQTMEYLGQLPDKVLAQVDKALEEAETLSVADKRRVVPNYRPPSSSARTK